MDSCSFTDKTPLKKYFFPCVISAVLTHGHAGQLHGDPRAYGPHANLCMLCTAFFFNTDFVRGTNTINIHVYLILSTFTFLFLSVVM
jgi:hypothetical protein